MVEFDAAGDTFVVPVRTVGRHPNLFLYGPSSAVAPARVRHRWDLIDMHEEPFGLAVAEVLILRRLRAPRVPFVVSSAQNIDKRYPPPFRWFERWSLRRAAGAYTCNTEAGEILRRQGTGGRPGVPAARRGHRAVPSRRAGGALFGASHRLRRTPHPAQGGRCAVECACPRRPGSGLTSSGPGPELDRLVALADTLGNRRSGDLPWLRRRGRHPRRL